MAAKLAPIEGGKKDKKNRKMVKKIDKIVVRLEKNVTKLLASTQKLQGLRDQYQKKTPKVA